MTRAAFLIMCLLAFGQSMPVCAENLSVLFSHRAQISTTGGGLCRLELEPEVLALCRSDFADLRVLTSDGREIPFLIDSPDPDQTLQIAHEAIPKVVSADRSRRSIDRTSVGYHETMTLRLPDLPDEAPIWQLVMKIDLDEFVVRIDIDAISGDGQRTAVLSNGSAFRLPSASAEKLRFPITSRDASLLEITLEGVDQGYVTPRFTVVAERRLATSLSHGVELPVDFQSEITGATELVVERPRGLVPRQLRFVTSTPTFHRRVTVWDDGPGAGAEPLGSAPVLRIAAIAPIEVIEVPVRAARGDRLRIRIDNEDSPPLENLRVEGLVPKPVLLFSLATDVRDATLVFGGGRAHRPRYDLLALESRESLPTTGSSAHQALAVLDPEQAMSATLGAIMNNPDFDTSPALEFAMHAGAEIDRRVFSHRRTLQVASSPEGLSRLELDPADLALLKPDLADLRIVDSHDRQWAYLVQHQALTGALDLGPAEHRQDTLRSHYLLQMPDIHLIVSELTIETPEAFFDRRFRLQAILVSGEKRVLARGRLIRQVGDPRPINLAFPATRVRRLVLEVSNGDDAPLNPSRFTAHFPLPEIYLTAEPGSYNLLIGNPNASPPHYELESVRSTVLAVPAVNATSGPLEENPDFSAGRRLSSAAGTQKLLLWVILGLAVIVLAVLTLRAARQTNNTE